MTSSIFYFCQGLTLVHMSTSYHIWKLRFHMGTHHVCKKISTDKGLKELDINRFKFKIYDQPNSNYWKTR